ncbi:hypothetical protein [Pseudomonas cerasi]|uniref:hypothetical protein n=1 Tax=Pseudomonas cerasi TaxID=1583341 RepID=UPI000806B38E|nr:hypothetical protein [Pseudomonas cerasi]
MGILGQLGPVQPDGQGTSYTFARAIGHAIERPGIRSTVSLTTLKDRRSSRLALSWEKILLETLEELVTVGAWKDATLWLGRD